MTLWRHQQQAFDFAVDKPASMLAIRMRGGKSRVVIELLKHWKCNRVLILCPFSVLNVWRGEFAKWAPLDFSVEVLDDKLKITEKKKRAEYAYAQFEPIAVVINYDSACAIDQTYEVYCALGRKRMKLEDIAVDAGLSKTHANAVLRRHTGLFTADNGIWRRTSEQYESQAFDDWALTKIWDCVVLDESHRCKGPNTRISYFVGPRLSHRRKSGLADKTKRRICLTGSPMGERPSDIFGQYRFLDYRLFGKNWTPFRDKYTLKHPSIQNAMIDPGNLQLYWPEIAEQVLPGYFANLRDLQEKFGQLALLVGDDALDLPPLTHDARKFKLTGTAARIYRDLERDFMADLDLGVVTAGNALVKTLRLRQVVSGFVQPDESEHIEELHKGKETLLEDLLQDIVVQPDATVGRAGEPAVVFCEFTHDTRAVERVAERLKLRYGEVSGRRKDLTGEGTLPESIDTLAVQYKAGGLGINLSRARYGIIYSPSYSLTEYEQAMARLYLPGQKHSVHFYHLVAKGTIDEAVYRALEKKRNVVEGILAVLRARQMIEAPGKIDTEKVMDELEKLGGAITALDELES